jgi:hypothetical protein
VVTKTYKGNTKFRVTYHYEHPLDGTNMPELFGLIESWTVKGWKTVLHRGWQDLELQKMSEPQFFTWAENYITEFDE